MFGHSHVRTVPYKPGADASLESAIVQIVADDGSSGWGEACPLGSTYQPINVGQLRAGIELAAPAMLGLDPRLQVQIHRAIDDVLHGTNEARAAIDIACWDLAGQASRQRVCDLLGGSVTEHVPTYFVVRAGGPAGEAASQVEQLQGQGMTKFQIKAADGHIDATIQAVREVDAVRRPGVDLFVDVNRRWTKWQTIAFSNACADTVLAIEQPCNTYAECADARPHLRHPLLLDECATDLGTAVRAIATGVADGFGMKVSRIGGLTPMRAFLDVCRATSTPTSCDDSWGGDILAAACVHAAATLEPRLSRGAWIAAPYIAGHYDDVHGPRIDQGRIAVPTGPGLGLDIADDFFGEPISVWSR